MSMAVNMRVTVIMMSCSGGTYIGEAFALAGASLLALLKLSLFIFCFPNIKIKKEFTQIYIQIIGYLWHIYRR